MSIQINETDVINDNRKGIFQSANVGAFSNPTRPGSAATGDIIYSTTDSKLQVWNGSAWVAAGGGAEISATGGTKTTTADGFHFLHTFTSPGTFTLSTNGAVLDVFLIGGGGSGGLGGPLGVGGGGGAGGHILQYARVWASGTYPVSVGGGGGPAGPSPFRGAGNNGSNSTLSCPPSISAPGTLTALGGGGGAGGPAPTPSGVTRLARSGGCGGGGYTDTGAGGPGYVGANPSDPTQGGSGNGAASWRQAPYNPATPTGGGGGGIGGRGFLGGDVSQGSGPAGVLSVGRGVDGFYLNWASPTRVYYGGGGNSRPAMAPPYSPGYPGPVAGTPLDAVGTLAANTGGGGYGWQGNAGDVNPASSGNSGIVVIRYAKVQNL
jgi:hypothetical protein